MPSDWKNQRRFLPHPHAERFDRVTVETIERWKESELSGDEWRFSYIVTFYSHGQKAGTISAGSIKDALLAAAAGYHKLATPDGWREQIDDLCCHPGCAEPWTVLMHPIRGYTRDGRELVREPLPGEVRAFCERHRGRGDCALDDTDSNYVVVEERFPPNWAEVTDDAE